MSDAPARQRTTASRLSLAISLLALVVALSGTAVAATLAANSVGAKQLKKNAVKTAKIKNKAVTGAKIRNRSIKAADLADGVLPGASHSYDYHLAVGDTIAEVGYEGLRISHECVDEGGDILARTLIQASGNTLNVAGSTVRFDAGTTTTTTAYTINGTTLQPGAAAGAAAVARTSFEGIVRGSGGPWVHATVAALKNTSASTPCNLRGLFTVER